MHSDFDDDIEQHAEEFDAAEEAMLGIVLAVIAGRMSEGQATSGLQAIADDLKARSAVWVRDILPIAYTDGLLEASGAPENAAERLDRVEHRARIEAAQRRLLRRLVYAADGLVVDALDRIDEAVENELDGALLEVPVER